MLVAWQFGLHSFLIHMKSKICVGCVLYNLLNMLYILNTKCSFTFISVYVLLSVFGDGHKWRTLIFSIENTLCSWILNQNLIKVQNILKYEKMIINYSIRYFPFANSNKGEALLFPWKYSMIAGVERGRNGPKRKGVT